MTNFFRRYPLSGVSLLQSRYFDCEGDDDFDTFSNLSAFTETNEFSARADNDEENFCCCNGEDEFCKYGCDTCENVEEE